MKRLSALFLILLPFCVQAQELEYRMEVGGAVGTDFYLGDVCAVPFKHPSVMGGILLRNVLNPRMVVKSNLAFGHLRGNSSGTFIPSDAYQEAAAGGNPAYVSFKRNVVDFGAQFEMNFWGFGTGEGYKGNRRCTPYATAGLGFTLAMGGGGGTNVGLNFPIGVGVKYKLKPRVNVGAEWTFRFTTTDALDVNGGQASLSHPYGIKAVGLKNKDAYSFLMVFMTYDIGPKYRQCNN
ncbi:MAG: hypothetical protein HUK02_00535 [Bacteroidaceae bacterium]|nr:hypothetical protein [Bacteroidaceae bacterium]